MSARAVKFAAANGSPIRVERDARLQFVSDGMKCRMESFIENVSTRRRIPMCRMNGVFVMRVDTQPCQKVTKFVKFDEKDAMRKTSVFRRLA